jgi:hypothetical protein
VHGTAFARRELSGEPRAWDGPEQQRLVTAQVGSLGNVPVRTLPAHDSLVGNVNGGATYNSVRKPPPRGADSKRTPPQPTVVGMFGGRNTTCSDQ